MIDNIALQTDLYQLTMAQGYWKLNMHENRAVFDLSFREHPFKGGYTVCCGLETVMESLKCFAFSKEALAYLSTLSDTAGEPLFDPQFLALLSNFKLSIDMDAIVEGTLVFPKEPLLRVEGPLWECQLIETLLLNRMNFPSLIATKALRIFVAAQGDPIIEFGLRRAQGPDGGLTASRAAYIGGASATSNVLAGQQFGIPVMGTHAHSWVMAFANELTAFEAYASVMPDNCVLLVDTYQSLEGIRNAITVGSALKKMGKSLIGIRLDSGDLANLSKIARQALDEAGLTETKIIASSDLDEYKIALLKASQAKISQWGLGTRLVTGFDCPALGGVYKLVAIQDEKGHWHYKAKQTDEVTKKMVPGIREVLRYSSGGKFVRDCLQDVRMEAPLPLFDETVESLLVPVMRKGQQGYQSPPLTEIRARTMAQLEQLPDIFKQLNPEESYPVLMTG